MAAISKANFVKYINKYLSWQKDQEIFDDALKKYAPSDFTGFYDERILIIPEMLALVMNDTYDYIGWWLWETDYQNPEFTKIYDNETSKIIADIRTPGDLYDYIVANSTTKPTPDEIVAQDNGVRFSLKIVQDIIDTNYETSNYGWEERNALLNFVKSKISTEYLLARGVTRLDINGPFNILTLEEDD